MKSLATLLATAALALLAAAPATAAGLLTQGEAEKAAEIIRAVPGEMLSGPAPGALRKQLPLRLSVRVPKGTTKLTVTVGKRDVSKRFRGNRVRVARLDRGDGLRYGLNKVFVYAERGESRPLSQARSFYVLRKSPGLIGLRVKRKGAVATATVELRNPPRLTLAHLDSPAGLTRQLEALQRPRSVRLFLNGKPVSSALEDGRTRWTAKLSATHGLRYGVNHVRAVLAEPEQGRFAVVRQSFRVARTTHLASAGPDRHAVAGGRVRLDGRRSRVAGGGKPAHSWRLVAKPRGSKARLTGAGSARPGLTTDRPGRYVVRLSVSERQTGKSRAGLRAQRGSDAVEVIAAPRKLLIPFTAFEPGGSGEAAGRIKVDGTTYAKPSQGDLQLLILNRQTLNPEGAEPNGWFDKDAQGAHSLQALYTKVKGLGIEQLAVLTMARTASAQPANSSQVDEFNAILNLLGVESLSAAELTTPNQQLAVIGVPYAKPGSGWISRVVDATKPVLNGWLMPGADSGLYFQFQSERPAFDTQVNPTATSNTMTFRTQGLAATLPEGSSGGFQVVLIDPDTFTPVDNKVFSTNSTGVLGSPLSGRRAMTQYLRDNDLAARGEGDRQLHVAIQSIGTVGNFVRPDAEEQFTKEMGEAWLELSRVMASYGANPHTFNTANGTYAFLGGPRLTRAQSTDSSSVIVINPTRTPPQRESGALAGRAAVTADGFYDPVIASPADSLDMQLYDKVFRPATPWPLTGTGGKEDRRDFTEALGYISGKLGAGNNIRASYWSHVEESNSDRISKLRGLIYPVRGSQPCKEKGGKGGSQPSAPTETRPGFSRVEFCEMRAQLLEELEYLDRIRGLFESFEKALAGSEGLTRGRLETLGTEIENALKETEGEKIGWSIAGFLSNLISAGLPFAPEGEVAKAAWETLVSIYELSRELADASGEPLTEQVESEVSKLSVDLAERLSGSIDGLVRMQQVIASDWGRIKEVGSVVGQPGWNTDVPGLKGHLTTSAETFFYSKLLPLPYGVHALVAGRFSNTTNPEECYVLDYGHTFRGAPESAKMLWMGDFNVNERQGEFPTQFVLGLHSLSASRYAYPPAAITNHMFEPEARNGLGMQLQRYAWESFEPEENPPGPAPPTDIAYCS